MEFKEELMKQSAEVNILLTTKIEVSEILRMRSKSFKANFHDLNKLIEDLEELFLQKHKDLESFVAEFENSIHDDYWIYLMQLVVYFEKLHDSVRYLKERQNLLLERSQGYRRSIFEMLMIGRKYNKSIKAYAQEGDKLQTMLESINLY